MKRKKPARKRERSEKQRAPLRKVVGVEQYLVLKSAESGIEHYGWQEVLECGHRVRIRQDFYGETHADSRRCIECLRNQVGNGR